MNTWAKLQKNLRFYFILIGFIDCCSNKPFYQRFVFISVELQKTNSDPVEFDLDVF